MHSRGGHFWFTCLNFFHCKLLHLTTTFIKIPNSFISIQFGQNFAASHCETFKTESRWDARGRASTEAVAAQVGSSLQAVRSLRRRFVQTGSTEALPRRPRVTTPAQDRYILSQHLRNHFLTATATVSITPGTHNLRISAQTVRNSLAENNLRARRPYVGTVLTARHRRDRLQWADRHINWTRQDWRTVLFFQMNPGLHCPKVMVGPGSTDVGMNVTLTVAFFSGVVLVVGVP